MSNNKRRTLPPRKSVSIGDDAPNNMSKKSTVVAPSSLPAYGKSLFPIIWKIDPLSSTFKCIMMFATFISLCALFFLPSLMTIFAEMDGSWDELHGVNSFLSLMEATLGLSDKQVLAAFAITLFVFGGLVAADLVLGKNKEIYPSSWNTDNATCYLEMFAEPTRLDRLIRRPGNALSNASYFFGSVCILLSTSTDNTFWMGDVMFGIMLFILALASVVWHGSNAPASQYPDLWSMDGCILYLIIRYGCFGGMCLLKTYNPVLIRNLAGWTCVTIFAFVTYKIGMFQRRLYEKRWLHGSCPFAVRSRLVGKSDLFGHGHVDIRVMTVCAYVALPVYYTAIPTAIQFWCVGSMGSVLAANLAFRTLLIGWTYRMLDRWTLDGCFLINWIVQLKPATPLGFAGQTVFAAIASPTAVLHAMTGITLLAGYMHARSVDKMAWS